MQLRGPLVSTGIRCGRSCEPGAARLVCPKPVARTTRTMVMIEKRLDWFMVCLLLVDRSGLDTKKLESSAKDRVVQLDEAR